MGDAGAKPSMSSNTQSGSNKIMDLKEMIEVVRYFIFVVSYRLYFPQFDITAITQRNTILEANNLHYINKHYLMQRMKDPAELFQLAMKVENHIREEFPERSVLCCPQKVIFDVPSISPYITTETIARAISLLEVCSNFIFASLTQPH